MTQACLPSNGCCRDYWTDFNASLTAAQFLGAGDYCSGLLMDSKYFFRNFVITKFRAFGR